MVALSPSREGSPVIGGAVRRSAALGEVPDDDWSADFGVFGADPGVEVFAAQTVAVALQAQDL